jgi:hypothetical protein
MGELVQKSTTAQWLVSIEQSRSELIEAAKTGNKIATAFAMAEARVRLIESLDNEEVKARLLRMTDPRIGMVELANNPTEEDRIRVCAIAILSGFCPGEDQFAVFGGKGTAGGKLYTKEAGFRTLFAHLGIVPEVQTGHPEFVPLGTSGKKVWRVGGKASCEYAGKSYSVDFSGPAALGISGYETDNVAGIAAKARRRMLQALWAKVSPILTQDQADDADVIPEAPLAAIENTQPVDAKPDTEILRDAASNGTINRLRDILKSEPDKLQFVEDVCNQIQTAATIAALEEAGDELAKMKADYSSRVLSLIRPLYQSRLAELKGGAT